MKRPLCIIIIILLLLPHLFAEQRIVQHNVIDKHYGTISVGGGYYSLLEHFDDLNTIGGFATSFGGGYQFNYNGLWISIMGEFQFWQSNALTKGYQYDQLMYDTQGKKMTYHFDLSESRENSYGAIVNLPIMIGYTINGFYIGAGAKSGYNLFAKNKTSRSYFTYATYPQYFEDFAEMPNHYYTEYTTSNKEKLHIQFPISVIGEIGYDVLYGYSIKSFSRENVLRIGVYFEYGVRNVISTKVDSPLFETDAIHPTELDVFSYYNHKATTSHKVVPINVGIKLTYMIRIPTRNCNCN